VETIKAEKMVDLKYTMKTHLPDGTIKDHSEENIGFIFGVEHQVPTLEKALNGCPVGHKMSLDIPASEIYGDHDPELIREIPKEGLKRQRLKVGQFYRQMKRGVLISFKVLEIRPHSVLADFNKPMTGISVSMNLEVLAVRAASRKEIDSAKEAQNKKSIGCG